MKKTIFQQRLIRFCCLLLLCTFIKCSGFAQSVTSGITFTNGCQGQYNNLWYYFTPPSNASSYYVSKVELIKNSSVYKTLYNYSGNFSITESGYYYIKVTYNYKVAYQYQCGAQYCCQSGPFGTCAKYCTPMCTGYYDYNNYVSYSNTYIVTVNPRSYSSINVTRCSNNLPYTFEGYDFWVSQSTNFTYPAANGCDSIVTVNFTVANNSAQSTQFLTLCSNALPYSWNGMSITDSGTYTKTLASYAGCDSVATLILSLTDSKNSDSYASVCTTDLPYVWNGNNYDSSGNYSVNFPLGTGCDSVATLHLSVNANSTTTVYDTVCASKFPFYKDVTYIPGAGTYTMQTYNSNGCPITLIYNVASKPNPTSTLDLSLCPSQFPYYFNGSFYYTGGTYYSVYNSTNISVCDSFVILNISSKTNTSSTTNASICPNQIPYSWGGSFYGTSGTYVKHFTNSQGCDSTATLNLTVKTTSSSTQSITICQNNVPYNWNGQSLTSNGTYTALLSNSQGCDSTVTLNLTINQLSSSTTTTSVCSKGLPFGWNGVTVNGAGTYLAHLTNKKGCDSAATLVLSVLPEIGSVSIVADKADSICLGTRVTYTANTTIQGGATVNPSVIKYVWYKNSGVVTNPNGANNPVYYDENLASGDIVFCKAYINDDCTTAQNNSNAISFGVKLPTTYPKIAPSNLYGYWADASKGGGSMSLCTLGAISERVVGLPYGGYWENANTTVTALSDNVKSTSQVIKALTSGYSAVYYKILEKNCTFSVRLGITVDTDLVAPISGPTQICVGGSAIFTHPITNAQLQRWNCLTGHAFVQSSNGNSAIVYGTNASNGAVANVRFVYLNSKGCVRYKDYYFTVNPKPAVPGIQYSPGTVNPQTGTNSGFCAGRSFTLVGTPSGGTWSYWQTPSTHITVNPTTGLVTTLVNGSSSNSVQVTYTYTDANGCSNSRIISGTVVNCPGSRGVNTNEAVSNDIKFTLYPNPAHTVINLNINSLVNSGTIVITDLYGKEVKRQILSMGNNTIDIASLSKGIYMVSVITSSGKQTQKIVVE